MMPKEFGEISRRLGVGGDCADFMWNDLELFYMSDDSLDKEDAAIIYWKHTGLFETAVATLKALRETGKALGEVAPHLIAKYADKVREQLAELDLVRGKIQDALTAFRDEQKKASKRREGKAVAA